MLQDELNKVIEYAAGPEFSDEVHKAKKEYQEVVGHIFEDDESFDNRMTAFLEWYTLDRFPADSAMTPLMAFVDKNKKDLSPETLKIYEDMAGNIHGIFIVKKIKSDHVIVLNLFDKTKYTVQEKQSELIFRKSDIFEGRIVTYQEENYFTGTYCFHPQKALKVIKSGISQLEKNQRKIKEELQHLEKEGNKVLKEIEKVNSKIEQVNYKIAKSRSLMETTSLEEKKSGMKIDKSDLENRLAELNEQSSFLMNTKINREFPEMRSHLMQRFLYMNLKWERFRQIDIKDIYRI